MFCPRCNNDELQKIPFCDNCGAILKGNVKENFSVRAKPKKSKAFTSKPYGPRGISSMQKQSTQIELKPSPKSVLTTTKADKTNDKPTPTSEIHSKKTSPTLVEFQNKNAQIPEWRLQLKNAVQKRFGQNDLGILDQSPVQTIAAVAENTFATSDGNELKADIVAEGRGVTVGNQPLVNALKRIEQSRNKFYIVEKQEVIAEPIQEAPQETAAKEFPFTIASRNENPTPFAETEELKSSVNFPKKPQLVPTPEVEENKNLYDTSELDPDFPPARISTSFERQIDVEDKVSTKETATTPQTEKRIEEREESTEASIVVDEIAPVSFRFNAGLFDLLIGSFSGLILLSPFMLLGGDWFSVAGFFAFLTTCAIVMFIYLTTTIGLFGKTFGMHLFSIEMVDYFDDEYPTFHQAAVSSSIYLLSLAFGGVGFITTFFDEDKRAVHDMVSGTLIVKEL